MSRQVRSERTVLPDHHRDVNPAMVILGRKSRSLSQQDLANVLGVTQGRISKIEKGFLPVPDDLLDALSRVLDYPPDFFTQGGDVMGVGIAELFHRKRQNVAQRILDRIYAIIDIQTRHIATLLESADIPRNVPHLDIDDYGGRVEDVARYVRAHWNLPRGPIKDMVQVLEDAGVVIVPSDFQTRHVDAISRWSPDLPPVIFINAHSPKDRCRSSLAHELGHLVMHNLPSPEMEEQANLFAAEFLLPEYDVRPDLQAITLPRLAHLKRYWKVSMNMLLMRAQELGIVTGNQARYLWTQMSKAGYRTHEPVELDVQGEEPRLLCELIQAHQDELGYTVSELQRLLRLNEVDLRSYYLHEDIQPALRLVHSPSATLTSRA